MKYEYRLLTRDDDGDWFTECTISANNMTEAREKARASLPPGCVFKVERVEK